ncbi:MAG: lipopolysaccharide transport periplasmic protein LptA [Micropepsaceae bacterium]
MKKIILSAMLLPVLASLPALAQGTPNPFSGMGRDSDQPISITADSTTADMRAETATYAGNVHVVQGNLHLRADTLSIKATNGAIEHIEAQGGVVLASPQGQATGAAAIYDISQRTVKLSGKVTLVKGPNAMQGSSLVVNLATGKADLLGGGSDGRVTGIFVPSKTPTIATPGSAPKPMDENKDTTPKP